CSGRGRHTSAKRDWSSDVCSSDLSGWPRGRPCPALRHGQLRTTVPGHRSWPRPHRSGRPVPRMLWRLLGLTCRLHRPRAGWHRSGDVCCLVVVGKTLCQWLGLFLLGPVGATGCRRSTEKRERGAACAMNTHPTRRCALLGRPPTWESRSAVVVGRAVGRELSITLFYLPGRSLRSRSTGYRTPRQRRL